MLFHTVPSVTTDNSETNEGPSDIANNFNNYFAINATDCDRC